MASAAFAVSATKPLELFVAGDKISLGIDLDHGSLPNRKRRCRRGPSAATRPAFLAALARPLVRNQSMAASIIAVGLGRGPSCSPSCPAPVLSPQFLHQSGGNVRHGSSFPDHGGTRRHVLAAGVTQIGINIDASARTRMQTLFATKARRCRRNTR